MSDRVVHLERFPDELIAVLTFERPPLNAIDEQMITELAAATLDLTADDKTRAVLVRSALDLATIVVLLPRHLLARVLRPLLAHSDVSSSSPTPR